MTKGYWQQLGKAPELKDARERFVYRLFEMLPAALAWGTFGILVLCSWLLPAWVAVFIIVYDLYWLFRTVYLTSHLLVSYRKIKANLKEDWVQMFSRAPKVRADKLWHLVLLPTYTEDVAVVRGALEALKMTTWEKEKMVVVVAQEERAGKHADIVRGILEKEYKNVFPHFFFTRHPAELPGELAGKGSNLAFAARVITESFIVKRGIAHRDVIVSAFDIDTQVPPQYFERLSCAYLSEKDPTKASYQPVPFYHNNIWKAPALARITAYSATFWQMIQQERPEQQTTFSSHSMSLAGLVEVGFWQTNLVSEDSRIFLQHYLRYDAEYRIVPLYYPVSMDANVASGFWKNMAHIYKQQRRWAWGVENIPYLLFGFLKQKSIPLREKFRFGRILFGGFYSWSTASIIIFLFGWLPTVLGGVEFETQLLSYNLPRTTQFIMTVAMVGLATSAVLSVVLMPALEGKSSKRRAWWFFVQWLLVPLNLIVFGALPALEAQTRLALGKYMGFWVTEKGR